MKPIPIAEFKAGHVPLEQEEQAAVVQWLRTCRPDIHFFAVPNGGKRHPKTARALKAAGVSAGVPDLCFPHPRATWHGFYLEMKRRKGGRVDPDQQVWIDFLKGQNYCVGVAYGADEARQFIESYFKLGPFQGRNHADRSGEDLPVD